KVVSWTAVRVEDQKVVFGKVDSLKVGIKYNEPGNYRVNFLNEVGISLGRINQLVIGTQLKSVAGSIEITTNKVSYVPGEEATFLISTPEEVDELLLTLERDAVEAYALASVGASWVNVRKLSKQQWVARVR